MDVGISTNRDSACSWPQGRASSSPKRFVFQLYDQHI